LIATPIPYCTQTVGSPSRVGCGLIPGVTPGVWSDRLLRGVDFLLFVIESIAHASGSSGLGTVLISKHFTYFIVPTLSHGHPTNFNERAPSRFRNRLARANSNL
jgi:hypothetical protein